jgi:hypothetical protein
MRLLAFAFAVVLATGCAAPRNEQCKQVCQTEERCIDGQKRRDISFDRGECEAACSALVRDEMGKQQVARHIKCVVAANNDCSQIIQCME